MPNLKIRRPLSGSDSASLGCFASVGGVLGSGAAQSLSTDYLVVVGRGASARTRPANKDEKFVLRIQTYAYIGQIFFGQNFFGRIIFLVRNNCGRKNFLVD